MLEIPFLNQLSLPKEGRILACGMITDLTQNFQERLTIYVPYKSEDL